jgi:hypothetical protein
MKSQHHDWDRRWMDFWEMNPGEVVMQLAVGSPYRIN